MIPSVSNSDQMSRRGRSCLTGQSRFFLQIAQIQGAPPSARHPRGGEQSLRRKQSISGKVEVVLACSGSSHHRRRRQAASAYTSAVPAKAVSLAFNRACRSGMVVPRDTCIKVNSRSQRPSNKPLAMNAQRKATPYENPVVGCSPQGNSTEE